MYVLTTNKTQNLYVEVNMYVTPWFSSLNNIIHPVTTHCANSMTLKLLV